MRCKVFELVTDSVLEDFINSKSSVRMFRTRSVSTGVSGYIIFYDEVN